MRARAFLALPLILAAAAITPRATAADAGVVKNRGNIWIWYTDDDKHVPVQMRARLFWGTITFRLAGNENK